MAASTRGEERAAPLPGHRLSREAAPRTGSASHLEGEPCAISVGDRAVAAAGSHRFMVLGGTSLAPEAGLPPYRSVFRICGERWGRISCLPLTQLRVGFCWDTPLETQPPPSPDSAAPSARSLALPPQPPILLPSTSRGGRRCGNN